MEIMSIFIIFYIVFIVSVLNLTDIIFEMFEDNRRGRLMTHVICKPYKDLSASDALATFMTNKKRPFAANGSAFSLGNGHCL